MPSLLARSYRQTVSTEHFVRFITSWCLPPAALAAVRALISLYIFTTLFTDLGFRSSEGTVPIFFSYFTILTYWGLGFYFAVSAGHGFFYSIRGPCGLAAGPMVDTPGGPETMTPSKQALRLAHSAYYATVTVLPFVVTLVFWTVLADDAFATRQTTWANISEHALNSVFAAFEICIPRSDPNTWINVPIIVTILALYLSLAFLSHAINHVWVYSFLNIPRDGSTRVAVAIILILVGTIIVFAVVYGLLHLRKWLTERKLGYTGKFSTHDERRPGTELQEVQVENKA